MNISKTRAICLHALISLHEKDYFHKLQVQRDVYAKAHNQGIHDVKYPDIDDDQYDRIRDIENGVRILLIEYFHEQNLCEANQL